MLSGLLSLSHHSLPLSTFSSLDFLLSFSGPPSFLFGALHSLSHFSFLTLSFPFPQPFRLCFFPLCYFLLFLTCFHCLSFLLLFFLLSSTSFSPFTFTDFLCFPLLSNAFYVLSPCLVLPVSFHSLPPFIFNAFQVFALLSDPNFNAFQVSPFPFLSLLQTPFRSIPFFLFSI